MKKERKPHRYWTLEKCLEDARKYNRRSEWDINSSAYSIALRNGWLEVCCEHMLKSHTILNVQWNENTIIKESEKFDNVGEWREKSPSSYQIAFRLGILEKCTSRMKKVKRANNHWVRKAIIESAQSFDKPIDWKNTFPGAYRAACTIDCLDAATKHMKNKLKKREDYTIEKCRLYALLFKNISEFKKKYSWVYQIARENGWLSDICNHMRSRTFWTFENVYKDAKKYMTSKEWRENSPYAYTVAMKNGWLKSDICAHMNKKRIPHNKKWTFEVCKATTKSYKYSSDWRENWPGAYKAACDNRWLHELTKDMKKIKRGGISSYEKEYLEILLEIGLKPKKNATFDGCRYKKKLRFDIHDKIETENLLWEIDGPQHEKPINFGGDLDVNKQLNLNKIRDNIKNIFSTTTPHFHLLRVHHSEFKGEGYREKLKQNAIKFVEDVKNNTTHQKF